MNLAVLRHRERSLRRGAGALAGVALLLVGVPVLLLQLSYTLLDSPNPLTGATAPWRWSPGEIKDVLTRALDEQTVVDTIARIGLAVAWIAVLVIAITVVLETRSLRLHGVSLPRVHGFGWSQAIARRLASGLLALSTVIPVHLAAAAPLSARAATTLPYSNAPPSSSPALPGRMAPSSGHAEMWTTYTVVRGDSIYGIAGRLAGGDRVRTREIAQQILDRNLGRTMNDGQKFTSPGFIQVGWVLDIPYSPGEATADPTLVGSPDPGALPADGSTYVVERGDSYWEIADHHLEILLGHEPTDAQVLDHTHELMDANVERLGNRTPAAMIYAGDVLVLPPPNGTEPPTPAPIPEDEAQEPPTAEPTPPPLPSTTVPAEPNSAPPAETPSTTTATSPPTPPVSIENETPIDDTELDETSNPWRALAIGSLFATGMAATVMRLRRRHLARRRPGYRLKVASPSAAMTETVLHAEARPDRVAALHRLLGDMAGRVRLEGARPLVRAAQLTDDGVELLWTEPQPAPPKPWATTDGGWSWRTPWPASPQRSSRPAPMLPTLVPVGVRENGEEVLIDLETAGSLSIDGQPELVAAFITQLVLSLGSSPLADNLDLMAVALDVPGAERMERLRGTRFEEALEWTKVRTSETEAALRSTKVATVLGARLRGRVNDEWEPLVVLAPSAEAGAAKELVQVCAPGSGSAAVLTCQPSANERIVIHSAEKAEWVGLGIVITPYLVTPEAGADLAELLDHAENADEREAVLNDSPIVFDEAPTSTCADGLATKPYDVLVRVLGEVVVEGCPEHLTEAEVELLALLATARPDGPINIDRLATLLAHDEWRTPKIRSIQARISHLRRKLGAGADGSPLLPDSRAATGSPSRYLLSARVVTDVDLLDHAYRCSLDLSFSEATPILRSALELVRGKPYTAKAGYSWAYDEHAASRAVQVVGDAASRLVDLYGEAGDLTGVRATIERASRAIDDPMGEVALRLAESRLCDLPQFAGLRDSAREFEVRLASYLDENDPDAEVGGR